MSDGRNEGLRSLERIDKHGNQIDIIAEPKFVHSALLAGEPLHRELRPDIPHAYCDHLELMFSEGCILTQLVDGGDVRAIAVWRRFHTTYCGNRLEIDDLVTTSASRSCGYGATMLRWIEARARQLGCETVTLNSATHREAAHRFYFRERYTIFGFYFTKSMS
jgi:GNAT superfamily N-acetyltransferase